MYGRKVSLRWGALGGLARYSACLENKMVDRRWRVCLMLMNTAKAFDGRLSQIIDVIPVENLTHVLSHPHLRRRVRLGVTQMHQSRLMVGLALLSDHPALAISEPPQFRRLSRQVTAGRRARCLADPSRCRRRPSRWNSSAE